MNTLLSQRMLEKEAQAILRYKWGLKDTDLNLNMTEEKIDINYKRTHRCIYINMSDLIMSLDDFSIRILEPLIFSLFDWNRAFKIETWVKNGT